MFAKLPLIWDVLYGLVVIFALVGGFVRPGEMLPVAVLTIACIVWVASQIIRRMTAALKELLLPNKEGE